MKKNFYLGFIALTALTVTSCSNDDVVMQSPEVNKAIEFGTYLGRDAQTRAAELTTTGLQQKGFGVFAFYTEQKNWAEANPSTGATSTPNFMFNQEVEYNTTNSAWEYSPIKYWPEKKNDKISFFAYGPYYNYAETPANTVTFDNDAKTKTGAPTVKFIQSTDVTKMVDFVAGVAMDQTYSAENGVTDGSKTVNFNLKHELTRLNFVAKLERDAFVSGDTDTQNKTKVNITSVKIDAGGKFYASADYTFATQDDVTTGDNQASYRGTWSNHSEATQDLTIDGILNSAAATELGGYTVSGILLADDSEVPLFKPAVQADETSGTEAQAAEYLFLIPPVQTTMDGSYVTGLASGDEIKVTFTYDIVTVDNNLSAGHSLTTATKTVSLPTGATASDGVEAKENTLQQGKAYKFTFTFGLHEIIVNATVADWDTEENGDATINAGTEEPASN